MLNRLLLATTGGLGAFLAAGVSEWAEVYATVTQAVPHNTNTAMEYDTVASDLHGYWDPGDPTRLTVPAGKGGLFIPFAGSFTLMDPAQDCIIFVQVNGSGGVRGSVRSYAQTGSNNNPIGYIATNPVPVELDDGDYIEQITYVDNSPGGGTFGTVGGGSPIWLALLRL